MKKRRGGKRIRLAAAAMSVLLTVSQLAGCGDTKTPEDPSEKDVMASPGSSGAGNEQGTADTQEPEQVTVQPATPAPEVDRSGVFELFSHMTVGWNLGNTFDAIGAGNTLDSETYWGNPRTTKEMIDAISGQGINTLRIPVTWAEHVGPAPDYIIDEEWLDRVEEVVDYGLEDGMYVILDTHHEPDFWMLLDEDHLADTKAQLSAIWSQVAERFADRDEHLLFEGMNEPRTKGSAKEWSGGTKPEWIAVNELNGAFIDAVRSAGGHNESRCLIICTYGNNASIDAIRNLKIYDDANIAVAVHMYTPYFFTFDPDDGSVPEWDGSLKPDIVGSVKFVDSMLLQKGVPVIITEFGAVNKGVPGEVIKWLEDYLGIMNEYGLKCIWWDNGVYSSSGENFGIFDRRNLAWFSREIADALVENAVGEQ